MLGVQLLSQLVCEMNQVSEVRMMDIFDHPSFRFRWTWLEWWTFFWSSIVWIMIDLADCPMLRLSGRSELCWFCVVWVIVLIVSCWNYLDSMNIVDLMVSWWNDVNVVDLIVSCWSDVNSDERCWTWVHLLSRSEESAQLSSEPYWSLTRHNINRDRTLNDAIGQSSRLRILTNYVTERKFWACIYFALFESDPLWADQ